MILSIFKKAPERARAEALYGAIVEAARNPAIYEAGAPDTVEGRFDVLSAHIYLALRRLKSGSEADPKLAQALFDVFFQNMDDSLRELGVGDLTVGKKIRKMAETFYGRIGAYESAFDEPASARAQSLAETIARNWLGEEDATRGLPFAAAMLRAAQAVESADFNAIAKGASVFPSFKFAPSSGPGDAAP